MSRGCVCLLRCGNQDGMPDHAMFSIEVFGGSNEQPRWKRRKGHCFPEIVADERRRDEKKRVKRTMRDKKHPHPDVKSFAMLCSSNVASSGFGFCLVTSK